MESGTKLGHYEILSLLGKGGMGEVWKAKDTKLGREVAIKTLPDEFAQDADRLARFEREAKLLASLNHPNIAAIYGLEEDAGTRFLVLELVEGPTLADRIKQGAIPVEESLKLALQIADALKAAHDKGVIHRDLKPLNIKVTDDDIVKVLDFGLAKAFAGDEAEASVSNSPTLSMAATQQGVILGTAAYMSPEQAKGRTVDKRTDVWAFGCVLYEVLTGHQSFGASDVTESLAAVIRSEPQWDTLPANLHPRLRETVERCLEKLVAKRFQDIGDVKADIEKVLDDPIGVLVQPIAEVFQSKPQSKLPWVAAIILSAIVGGTAVWSLRLPQPPGPVTRFYHVLPESHRVSPGDFRVALSPDGSRMLHVADQQLYLRAMGVLESNPIPGTNESPVAPFFSPDGQWVGYWSQGQLKKIPIGGGAPVILCDARNPAGRISWGADDTVVWGQGGNIMRVSANGGTPELLIENSEEGTLGSPQILPDGGSVLFRVGSQSTGQIAVQSFDSYEPKILFPGVAPRYVSTGHIVYAVDDSLFAVGFDLDTLEAVGGPVPMVGGVQMNPSQYALSDSGTLVYVPVGTANVQRTLVWVDREGQEELINMPLQGYSAPRLSPDGGQIALGINEEEGGRNIWIWDLARETLTRLTFDLSTQGSVWTPDGGRITFASNTDGNIYWQAVDGSGIPEPLTDVDRLLTPRAFSPDGDQLLYTEGTFPSDIGFLTLDGGRDPEPLLATSFHESRPEVSPDGRWIAYESTESGQPEVYVRPFPAVNTGRWPISTGGGSRPLWSRDGGELLYLSGPGTVMAVSVDTTTTFMAGRPEVVVQGNYVTQDYDVSLDGQRFLMIKDAASDADSDIAAPKINIVLNWFEELKERVPVE